MTETAPERIAANHTVTKRLGTWTTARDLQVRARYGVAVLDLRSGRIPAGDIVIETDLDHATLTVLVADDATIDDWNLQWTGRGRLKDGEAPSVTRAQPVAGLLSAATASSVAGVPPKATAQSAAEAPQVTGAQSVAGVPLAAGARRVATAQSAAGVPSAAGGRGVATASSVAEAPAAPSPATARRVLLTGHARHSEIRVRRGGMAVLTAMFSRAFLVDLWQARSAGRMPGVADPTYTG